MTQKTLTNQYQTKLHEQIIKVCHSIELPLHDFSRGCKLFTNYQRIALIVLFMRSRKALRTFVFELHESKWPIWLKLKEIPGKSTLHDWFKKWNVSWIRNVLATTVAKEKPKILAIDATGFDSWARSRHYNKRLRDFKVRMPHLPYNKVDLIVDTKTKLIYDFVLRTKPRHDVIGAKTIIKRFKFKETLILADRGYDCESLHKLVIRSGNIMYAPVRDFKVKKPKGKNRQRCVNKHEQYGQRSIVESVNFSLKSVSRYLRSKLHYMKKREFAWKIVTYNLEKLSMKIKFLIKIIMPLEFPDTAL